MTDAPINVEGSEPQSYVYEIEKPVDFGFCRKNRKVLGKRQIGSGAWSLGSHTKQVIDQANLGENVTLVCSLACPLRIMYD